MTYMALGGSTNAAMHLIAMAGRAGVSLSLDDLGEAATRDPGMRQSVSRRQSL